MKRWVNVLEPTCRMYAVCMYLGKLKSSLNGISRHFYMSLKKLSKKFEKKIRIDHIDPFF